MNIALIFLGLLIFGLGIFGYVDSHQLVKTKTEVIRVLVDAKNINTILSAEYLTLDGNSTQALERLRKDGVKP